MIAVARTLLKAVVLRYGPTLVYRRPSSGLQPERLYLYLDALWGRRALPGAVVEVGCHLGGTAAIAYGLLRNTGFPKRYVAIDTFSGFVREHAQADVQRGMPAAHTRMFAQNSLQTVRKLLHAYGCDDIELLKGDIVRMHNHPLPEKIAVCLVDVDLELPVYAALTKIYRRLVDGGIILVDDCLPDYAWAQAHPQTDPHLPLENEWHARHGYVRFVREQGLPEQYEMGMGIITKGSLPSS